MRSFGILVLLFAALANSHVIDRRQISGSTSASLRTPISEATAEISGSASFPQAAGSSSNAQGSSTANSNPTTTNNAAGNSGSTATLPATRTPSFGNFVGNAASSLGNLATSLQAESLSAALGAAGAARETIGTLASQGSLATGVGFGMGSDTLAKIQETIRNFANAKMNLLNAGISTAVDAGGNFAQTGLGFASLYPRLGMDLTASFGR